MMKLQAFGSLDVRAPRGEAIHSVLSQPKRSAILVYLALAQPRGLHRRDTLLALFWPESDEDHARAALSTALSFLRRSLGEQVILTRGREEIGVDLSALATDVQLFLDALTADDPEGALDVYRGALLEGFHIVGCPEFEEWVEGERERLRRMATGAAWDAAGRRLDVRDIPGAELYAERALALGGLDESQVCTFIGRLAEAGERAGALRFYDGFVEALRRTLGLQPDRRTADFVASVLSSGAEKPPKERAAGTASCPRAAAPDEHPSPPGGSTASPSISVPRPPRRRVRAVLWAAVGVAGLAGWAHWGNPRWSGEARGDIDGRPALAVLPFENHSPDAGDAYFAGGMQDRILSRLSELSNLRVVSRTSAARYEDGGQSTPQIAAELGVDFIVEGSARLAGDRVRLIVQLIEATRDEHVWSQEYDLDVSAEDLLEAEGRIASRIAFAVGVELTPEERDQVTRVLTDDTEAYLLYLQGKEAFVRESQRGLIDVDFPSRRLLDEAVALDPRFAPALALLSMSLTRTHPDEERHGRARALAETALSIQSGLGEARVALGRSYLTTGQAAEAERQFRAAEEENPNLAMAVLALGLLQRTAFGAFDSAVHTLERALRLDPYNPAVLRNLGASYSVAHRYDDALELNRRHEEVNPSYTTIRDRAYLRLLRGEEHQARREITALFAARPASFYSFTPGAPWSVLRRLLTPEQRRVALEARLGSWQLPCSELSHDCLQVAIHEEEVGSKEVARIYWDSLAAAVEDHPPRLWWEHAAMPLVYQALGDEEAAIAAAETLVALEGARRAGEVPDRFDFDFRARLILARTLARARAHDRAIDLLEELLPAPSFISVPLLEIDPVWDPLRERPRFQALLR